MNNPYILSKVRICRNLENEPFTTSSSERKALRINDHLNTIFKRRIDSKGLTPLRDLSFLERNKAYERFELSEKALENYETVTFYHQEDLKIITNEENHLSITVEKSGLSLKSAFEEAYEIENIFDEEVNFAFHERYGYLMPLPMALGTGLKLSIVIHLKAFKETGRLKDFKRSINHIGFMMKPVFKDGRMDLYEISYQKGMDMSEEEALERFENIAERIYKNERHLRNEQVSKNRSEMEDSYYKALGTLKYGYFLSQEEIYNMVSNLLYGYSFGLREISLENIWLLVCMSQKYHLIEYKESVNSTRTLDSVRGDYIREFLKEAPYGQ